MRKSTKTILSLLAITLSLLGCCLGAVHKVGDWKGWTMMGVDYAAWASTKTFQVGDSLSFAYNKDYHDVTQVTLQNFQSCDPSSGLATYKTGLDSVNLTRRGHYYFICGVPGHCQAGQKLDVLVTPASLHPVVAPTPQPTGGYSSSPVPSASVNSPVNAPQEMVHSGASDSSLLSDLSKVAFTIGSMTLFFILI